MRFVFVAKAPQLGLSKQLKNSSGSRERQVGPFRRPPINRRDNKRHAPFLNDRADTLSSDERGGFNFPVKLGPIRRPHLMPPSFEQRYE
jgi:hypothetical protein